MKLLITDLDNTLLRSDKSISPYTAAVFARCREHGILTAFATNRSERAMTRMIEALHPDAIISNGGSTVKVGNSIVWESLLTTHDTETILNTIRRLSGGAGLITMEAPDGYYCNFIPWDEDRRASSVYTDFIGFSMPAYKITAELKNHSWANDVQAACTSCSFVRFTGEDWHRFGPRDAGKATALKALAAHLSLSMEDITAFGDDRNDLDMMEIAGTAVAVANAIDEVKAIADYVTACNNEDGVAKYIETHILFNR